MSQKYRADYAEKPEADGSVRWYTCWMGGPTLAKIQNCQIHGTDLRRMVYITNDPDTWFSIPAETKVHGMRITGYVTTEDDAFGNTNMVFRSHSQYHEHLQISQKGV
jgi:hypothetical protein